MLAKSRKRWKLTQSNLSVQVGNISVQKRAREDKRAKARGAWRPKTIKLSPGPCGHLCHICINSFKTFLIYHVHMMDRQRDNTLPKQSELLYDLVRGKNELE